MEKMELFAGVWEDGGQEDFQNKVNDWLESHPNIEIVCRLLSENRQGPTICIFYQEK